MYLLLEKEARAKRQSKFIRFGKEEEAEVLERWPEEDNFKECQCHKRQSYGTQGEVRHENIIREKVSIYICSIKIFI